MEHELTFEWDEEDEALEIHGNREGLKYLADRLILLAERPGQDHEHLMTEAWGGWEISAEANNSEATKINHVRLFKWPDDSPSQNDQ